MRPERYMVQTKDGKCGHINIPECTTQGTDGGPFINLLPDLTEWEEVDLDRVEPVAVKPLVDVESNGRRHDEGTYLCPGCDAYIGSDRILNSGNVPAGRYKYCPNCGQRIDWE